MADKNIYATALRGSSKGPQNLVHLEVFNVECIGTNEYGYATSPCSYGVYFRVEKNVAQKLKAEILGNENPTKVEIKKDSPLVGKVNDAFKISAGLAPGESSVELTKNLTALFAD